MTATSATEGAREARDFLLRCREDDGTAYAGFRRPRPEPLTWSPDWSDRTAAGTGRPALHIVEVDGGQALFTVRLRTARRSEGECREGART